MSWRDIGLLVIVVAMLALLAPGSRAHDFYPIECCSGQDCKVIADSDITPTFGGWFVNATGETVSHKATRQSPDGLTHRCSLHFDNPNAPDETICLFVPPMIF